MPYIFDQPYWRDPHRVEADIQRLNEQILEIEAKGRPAPQLRSTVADLMRLAYAAREYHATGRRPATIPMYKAARRSRR